MKKGSWFFLAVLLFTSGCSDTFLLSKNCTTYFLGSSEDQFVKTLCPSGDLERVLDGSALPADARAALREGQCTSPSREKVDRVYASLSEDQKAALQSAFRAEGYEINAHPANNFRIYPYYNNLAFCPNEKYY